MPNIKIVNPKIQSTAEAKEPLLTRISDGFGVVEGQIARVQIFGAKRNLAARRSTNKALYKAAKKSGDSFGVATNLIYKQAYTGAIVARSIGAWALMTTSLDQIFGNTRADEKGEPVYSQGTIADSVWSPAKLFIHGAVAAGGTLGAFIGSSVARINASRNGETGEVRKKRVDSGRIQGALIGGVLANFAALMTVRLLLCAAHLVILTVKSVIAVVGALIYVLMGMPSLTYKLGKLHIEKSKAKGKSPSFQKQAV